MWHSFSSPLIPDSSGPLASLCESWITCSWTIRHWLIPDFPEEVSPLITGEALKLVMKRRLTGYLAPSRRIKPLSPSAIPFQFPGKSKSKSILAKFLKVTLAAILWYFKTQSIKMMRYWSVVLGEGRLALIMQNYCPLTHQRTNIKRKEQVLSHYRSQNFQFYVWFCAKRIDLNVFGCNCQSLN